MGCGVAKWGVLRLVVCVAKWGVAKLRGACLAKRDAIYFFFRGVDMKVGCGIVMRGVESVVLRSGMRRR